MKRVLVSYRHAASLGPYEAAVRLAGMEPVPASPGAPISLDRVSGILLTGGEDVNPERYGQAAIPQTEPPDDERDAFELSLIAQALDRDLPLFAICRGLQILNVQHGGTLTQHIERHCKRTPDRALPAHSVTITPDTLLADIAGASSWHVNSRHHQAVARLGGGLIVSATDSEDGVVEALERPGKRFALAVQWHPEDQALVHPQQLQLFERFADVL